jgi:hypothetical protein
MRGAVRAAFADDQQRELQAGGDHRHHLVVGGLCAVHTVDRNNHVPAAEARTSRRPAAADRGYQLDARAMFEGLEFEAKRIGLLTVGTVEHNCQLDRGCKWLVRTKPPLRIGVCR